jgi:uncharacterized protein
MPDLFKFALQKGIQMRRFFLAALIGILSQPALAGPLPEPVSETVNDWANVLPAADESRLSASLTAARRETGVHLVVVTIPSLADFGGAGETMETYATRLFNAWGVGAASRHDGIMVLVLPGEKAMRIELGRGYGVEWDQIAQDIVNGSFLPAFKDGQMAFGIESGTEQVLTRIAQPFGKGDQPDNALPTAVILVMGVFGVIFFGIFGSVIWALAGRWFGDGVARLRQCPSCGQRGLHREHPVEVAATRTLVGRGVTMTYCDHCDHVDRRTWVIPMVRDSENTPDNNNGFGGGSSSGGGASGRW